MFSILKLQSILRIKKLLSDQTKNKGKISRRVKCWNFDFGSGFESYKFLPPKFTILFFTFFFKLKHSTNTSAPSLPKKYQLKIISKSPKKDIYCLSEQIWRLCLSSNSEARGGPISLKFLL
jgi:hypothetical protein